MPITFNHSNIGVQYSTGSNYIIETVKSDLYRRNELIDTIVRDNIQTAPVTPSMYIENGTNNVYAVESYTYSGTANTADFTRVFTKSTTCDILIVGGGGAGGTYIGGGGGGGGVLHIENATISAGTYNIQVGKGGTGVTGGASGTTAQNGSSSKAFGIEVFGGGYGGVGQWGTSAVQQAGANGGSGGGGGSCYTGTAVLGGTVIQPSFTSSVITANNYTYYGGNGASGLLFNNNSYGAIGANGGGGAGGNAPANTDQLNAGAGADGIAINITGTSYFWGGGGGGGLYGGTYNGKAGNGGKGGGGGGSGSQVADQVGIGGIGGITFGQDGDLEGDGTPTAGNGGDGTGGGGGGCGRTTASPNAVSGKGGSGIVIIRYLLGTIPANNLLTNANEPTFTSSITPPITPTLFTFKHKRGTNTQEIYTITFDTDTLCDILIVGGGGSSGTTGAVHEPGAGGGGGIVYMVNKTLIGTYNIRVGKGGIDSNGYDSEIRDINNNLVNFDSINLVGKGGGKGGNSYVIGSVGGSSGGNAGYVGDTPAVATQGNTFWDGTQYVQGGFNGGIGSGGIGGGGGGASSNASTSTGGNGRLVTITGFNQYYGGGGGGANGGYGGLGGGGSGRISGYGDGVKGTNDLGGGGGAPFYSSPGYRHPGGSGIVIIRAYKNIIDKNILTFRHSENYSEPQTRYDFTFTKNTVCDLLVVGGGGGGGGAGGSGGGGGVVTYNNVNFTAGIYTILVGYGGLCSVNNNGISGFNGNNSSINGNNINIEAAGGGGGGQYNSNQAPTPQVITYINPLTNISTKSQGGGGGVRFNSIPYVFDSSLSGIGGINTDNNAETGGAGGGAAPNILGGNGGNSFKTDSVNSTLGNGGAGIISTITGIPIEYGAGGSGSRWNAGFENTIFGMSTGGGGYAEFKDINNKNYIYNYFNGSPGTGGGGYAITYGGSGIVILKIKSVSETFYYTPLIKNLNYLINYSSYPYIPADATNLIAWYKFNGNSNDSNPTSVKHNFTTLSGTITYGSDSIINKPYLNLFNGTLSNSTLKLNNRAFTISYLFRLYTYDTVYYIFTTGATTTNNTLCFGSRGSNVYMMGFMNNDIDSPIQYREDVNNWVLFTAIVESNNNRKLYKNGVLIKSDTNTSAYIGIGNLELRQSKVDICDFRVYNRALTQNEIIELYNGYIANKFTANFPTRTIATINNGDDELFNGSYILNIGPTLSTIVSTQNQNIKDIDRYYSKSDILLRYNILNPVLDPIGAQWTYNTSNTNVYHMGRVGIGTTSPEYQLDVRGTLNAKAYYFNGVQIGRLSEGMVANVQHLTYTRMEIKNNTGWDAINDDLTTGFVISITPKSNLSKILINLVAHIGLVSTNDGRWWGIKLYRKIGTAAWAEVTGPNGTETGSAATTAGTPVWISHNMGTRGYAGEQAFNNQIINLTGTYLDSPNTTSIVYYTAYWNQRMGDNPSITGNLWLNRAANQNNAYRPAPSSSWTLKEIWYG
jgi:hypothetical protein